MPLAKTVYIQGSHIPNFANGHGEVFPAAFFRPGIPPSIVVRSARFGREPSPVLRVFFSTVLDIKHETRKIH